MIKGNLNNLGNYRNINDSIIDIIRIVKRRLNNNSEVGHYTITEGKAFFFIVYDHTQPLEERHSEIHARYIDIQIILEGEERLGYSLSDFRSIEDDFLDEKDIAFSEDIIDEQFVTLRTGDFIIFKACQPHRPLVAVGVPKPVKKAVVKIDSALVDF